MHRLAKSCGFCTAEAARLEGLDFAVQLILFVPVVLGAVVLGAAFVVRAGLEKNRGLWARCALSAWSDVDAGAQDGSALHVLASF
jgi:hypothetical protein